MYIGVVFPFFVDLVFVLSARALDTSCTGFDFTFGSRKTVILHTEAQRRVQKRANRASGSGRSPRTAQRKLSPGRGRANSTSQKKDGGTQHHPTEEERGSTTQAGDDVPVAMSATASTDRGSVSKRKRGRESEDEEDQARPVAFRTLPPAGTRLALALQGTQLRHSYDVCEVFIAAQSRTSRKRTEIGWRLVARRTCCTPCDKLDVGLCERQGCAGGDEHDPKASPKVACGGPPCMCFSLLDSLEDQYSPQSQKTLKMAVAAIKFITLQKQLGGSFMLEHPVSSRLWKLPPVKELVQEEVVHQIDFHMCAHGMRSSDSQGDGFALRPTRVLTNISALAAYLDGRCVGGHRHVHAEAGSSQPASHYTKELCDRILNGLEMDMVMKKELLLVAELDQVGHTDMCDASDNANLFVNCVDGRTGLALDPERVQQARAGVYEHVSEQEFQADPNAKLIGTTWVDCDKGTPGREEYRSRLCAQEFAKGEQRDDLFAGTPSVLATKLLASLCASTGQEHGKRLMVLDVKRAFLHGDIQRPVYIRLPAEDPKSCVPGLLGKLRKAMYGTRDAPAVWQKVVKEAMLSLGFVCSSSNPSVFRHELRDILVVTHVDDFLCCAQRDDLDWLWKSLSKRYTLKSKVLGPNSGEFREIEFLGRRFAWTRSGITYEADPKHVRVMLEEWCMTSCNKVASPGGKR